MSESKINIKIGHVEFSGEGNQDWLASQLDKVLEKVPELLKIETVAPQNNNGTPSSGGSTGNLSLSMTNIAAKLNSRSGQDLAMAAAAFLRNVQGKASFAREDILKNMKDATGYFKASYGSNLTNILLALVKNNSLTQSAENVYSIHVDKDKEINAILSK